MLSVPALADPTYDNLVGRVRGSLNGWEVAALSEPVVPESVYEWLDATWGDPETDRAFTFEYHASTGLCSLWVDQVGTVVSDDIGYTGYGFQYVYLQAIARGGDTLTINDIVLNGESKGSFVAPENFDAWSMLLYSGAPLDDIVVSGTFTATGFNAGSQEYTKFQIRVDNIPPAHDSHDTHLTDPRGPNSGDDCTGCHESAEGGLPFADGQALADTAVCDPCHSPGGAYDGVNDPDIGAKNCWDDLYETDGTTLMAGKEQWCAGCHDGVILDTVLVDDPDAVFDPDGDWSTLPGNGYGGNLRYKEAGTGSATGVWTPDVATAGKYDVYAWWIGGSSRATNAPYTIYYQGGSETVRLNQKAQGTASTWNLLGTYDFAAGTAGYVVLSDGPDAGGTVVGDAIYLQPADCSEVVVDTTAGTFDPDGDWTSLSGYGYGGDLRYKAEGTGSATAKWTPDVLEPGDYNVYACWIHGSARATNAPYTIYYQGGSETVRVNQKAQGTANKWNLLGKYPFAVGTSGYVVLSDGPGASGVVVGDAVRLELTDPDEVIVDTPAAGFDPDGDWNSLFGYGYRGDLRYKAGDDAGATATWVPDVPETADYAVYAWWIGGSARATNAPYTIYYQGGSETVRVNQKELGTADKWNLLGTYPFAAGTDGSVVLSDGPDTGGVVVGDAIRLFRGEGMGIDPPNVIGNDIDYGFYATGHNMGCLNCHDATVGHIDGNHRTYSSVAGNYQAGYRLKPVNGGVPMVVPRPYRGDLYADLDDFALCDDCHNLDEVLGIDTDDESQTNFIDDDYPLRNGHSYHLAFGGNHFDSDWDWIVDSTDTCIACHNVHGAPNQAMIRHGELMSSYGTTNKVPALNFCYLTSLSPEVCDPGAALKDCVGSKMAWDGTLATENGMCNAGCHGTKTMDRVPYLAPRVLAFPKVGRAPNNGSEVVLTAYVHDPDPSTVAGVSIDVSAIGGTSENMYDDGDTTNHGDETENDGIYSCKTTVAVDWPADWYGLTVTATDTDGTGTNDIMLEVHDPDEIIVDNPDAVADPDGDWSTLAGYGYGGDLWYKAEGTGSATVTWTPDVSIDGDYKVYAWWIEGGSRATNAPYTIYYDGGSETIGVNQKEAGTGGQWNELGTYPFPVGAFGYVVLSDGPGADGVVIADAIRLERQVP